MKSLLVLAVFLTFISPAFALGNITVTARDMVPAGNYTNSNTSIAMFNLSFAVSAETGSRTVTVTLLNISLGNGSTSGNISAVELYLSNDTTVIGSTRGNLNSTAINVSIPNTLVVNSTSNASVIVRFNTSFNATTSQLLSAILGSSADILVSDGSNVTVTSAQSNATRLQNLHANVTITPNFVDTNVINQTIVYTIIPTGRDGLNRTIITIPSGYNLTNVTNVEYNGGNTSVGSTVTVTSAPNYINITMNPTTNVVKVFFNVNTSLIRVGSSAFTSTIEGGNITGIASDRATTSAINVTTQQLVNVTNVAVAKAAAIINGTDYWEFNFTLNFTATANGMLQFKMSNWTDASNPPKTIDINTSSVYYATIRNNTNISDNNGKFNVTNFYQDLGHNLSVTENSTLSSSQASNGVLVLRMIIPSGTAVSNSWAATYNFLFRTL